LGHRPSCSELRTPSTYHIPYTGEYLKYLSAFITDAVNKSGIDGFMIDRVWQSGKSLPMAGAAIESLKRLAMVVVETPSGKCGSA